jgi:hypothetical protein
MAGRISGRRMASSRANAKNFANLREQYFSNATLLALTSVFSLIAFLFYFGAVRKADFYSVLALSATAWLAFEVVVNKPDNRMLRKALIIGIFLAALDFVAETIGGSLGLWAAYYSFLPIGYVPVEISYLALVGGTAWALYLPKKPSVLNVLMDILVFGIYGMAGEYVLVYAGLMGYSEAWSFGMAFICYVLTFTLLHVVRNRLVSSGQG